jgi:hypothetical protein
MPCILRTMDKLIQSVSGIDSVAMGTVHCWVLYSIALLLWSRSGLLCSPLESLQLRVGAATSDSMVKMHLCWLGDANCATCEVVPWAFHVTADQAQQLHRHYPTSGVMHDLWQLQ